VIRDLARAGGGIVDRIWLKQYPKGVPADIDISEYASLRDVFDESVAKFSGVSFMSNAPSDSAS
jgi:hypothetical protein